MRSKYIVIEGPDGCGKSSVALALKKLTCLKRHGVDFFKMPSHDGVVGQLIRRIFEKKEHVNPLAMMHLFNADAIDQEAYISGQLSIGRNVVLDRHTRISGCVYQVDYHPLPVALNSMPSSIFKKVDLCIILDAPAQVLADRIAARKNKPTDRLYTSTDLDRLEALRLRYAMAPYLHNDLANQWLCFDTSEVAPDYIAKEVVIALEND